jgi:hypothetical protein
MQKAARDLAGTQPSASSRVRDGLSDIQQNETKMRMKYSARYIRQGQGRLMVPREAPITQSLEELSRDLKAAQAAVNPNAQPGNDKHQRRKEVGPTTNGSAARCNRWLSSADSKAAARWPRQTGWPG